MKILHVSPIYWTPQTRGGGERFPIELCKALSRGNNDVHLVSFDPKAESNQEGNLKISIVNQYIQLSFGNPLSINYLRYFRSADVIHLHQYRTIISNIAILGARALKKPIFVTDLGGGGHNFSRFMNPNWVTAYLLVSKYSRKRINNILNVETIYAGVDINFFCPARIEKKDFQVLFVGRLLPHKGVDILIEAIEHPFSLIIATSFIDEEYLSYLKLKSQGRDVQFIINPSDNRIRNLYQSSMVTVLPSVYIDYKGEYHPDAELFGLVLAESMACGTPVIGSRVGSIPEVIAEGRTGLLFNPGDVSALRNSLTSLLNRSYYSQMSENCRGYIEEKFTWKHVAERCINAYKKYM